ncbi:uncharacterized protein GIQ15_04164 [Arthroderma uncinatum]|uniref:uncharacterized protein n=1 Tax=Arthroderma uncinatum TaxID=74035 RepID=UPI00144ABF20|nr:uncharacterized protein GIQ15_04164 [Arthroderma uncinatum]KAF3481405.1 hypothetical protein GIQ15_04164 [Arthroderma uncinatum]
MVTYVRRDGQRPASVSFPPLPSSSSSPSPEQSQRHISQPSSAAQLPATFHSSTLTEGIFESGIWTAEPDLNSAFVSGKWFSEEKIYYPGKTVPPSPEEKIVVTEYELRDNWIANEGYHSNASPMYGNTQSLPGSGRAEQSAETTGHSSRSSSTWRWTLGGKASPSDSMKGDGGYSPGGGFGRSSKASPESFAAAESRGFFRDSRAEGSSSRRQQGQEVLEVPSSKGSKTRLNLLNPMALLARRRSAQPVSPRPEDISISKLTVPALPDDYDPRIQKRHERPYERPPSIPASQSKSPPSTLRYKPPSVRDPSFTPLGLPRHLTSSASRFSFDLAGGASSSQERLMEEKHKEKEAAKRAQGSERRSEFDADSDEFDYDAMMDDDGLEERIPGVNADAESIMDGSDDGIPTGLQPTMRNNMNTYVPTLPTVIPSPISPHGGESLNQQSPVVAQQSPGSLLPPSTGNGTPLPSQLDVPSRPSDIPTYNNSDGPVPVALVNPGLPVSMRTNQHISKSRNDDDDMYYDDGLFGELPAEMQDSTFDESIFDDETSYLYDRKRLAAQPPKSLFEDITPNCGLQTQIAKDNGQPRDDFIADEPLSHGHPRPEDASRTIQTQASEKPQSQGLTEGNLEAYHSALAQAANDAARKGRFERNASLSETSLPEGESQTDPCLTADESRMSQTVDTVGMEESFDDFEYYDGDALDDDPIIAEANADVLENDDEGFYGQEFGFYAHSTENDNTERVYGGYFGVRGAEGVIRNHSGRKNFREPSLTPITERSEWSTRNSIVSVATHVGHSSQVSNPPLAQLVGMEGLEDDISLSALMKLRRGAWGGSNGSLRSSAASQGTTSPSVTHQSNLNHGNLNYYDTGSPIQVNSLFNNGSELNSPIQHERECIPTDTRFRGDLASIRRHSDGIHSPPSWDSTNRNSLRFTEDDKSQVTTSNGAGERISYVRSTDESGSQYWVLERRRTGDGGESELLERETMRHGRI